MRIEEAIQQKRFKSEFHKAQINLIYTAHWLGHETAGVLKPYGISVQQFNILRILRGLGKEPATVKLLTERMLDRMSNASRLVDKLLAKGLVAREECPHDRRRVNIWITEEGLRVVGEASEKVDVHVSQFFNPLSEAEARQLNETLDRIRS